MKEIKIKSIAGKSLDCIRHNNLRVHLEDGEMQIGGIFRICPERNTISYYEVGYDAEEYSYTNTEMFENDCNELETIFNSPTFSVHPTDSYVFGDGFKIAITGNGTNGRAMLFAHKVANLLNLYETIDIGLLKSQITDLQTTAQILDHDSMLKISVENGIKLLEDVTSIDDKEIEITKTLFIERVRKQVKEILEGFLPSVPDNLEDIVEFVYNHIITNNPKAKSFTITDIKTGLFLYISKK